MGRRWWLSVLALAACGTSGSQARPDALDLGALGKPAIVSGRDGGVAVRIAGRMLWLFSDTLMTGAAVDGLTYRSSTAGWASTGAGAGLVLEEPIDSKGAPFDLLPFSPDEWSYNLAGGPTERFALWPASALAQADDTALIFYSYLKVHPGNLNYENLGVGVARLDPGKTVARRDPGLLFRLPDRQFALGAIVVDAFVHLYACDPIPQVLASECRVARAPRERVTERAAWTAWDGSGWNVELARAAPVLNGAPGDLSVSWNDHTGSYLAVYSRIFANEVLFRTAPRPEGPWSAPRHLFNALPATERADYSAKEHPELASDGGRTVVVSYARPTGPFSGDVRLASVSLP
jgi:hypothetical protein